MRTLVPADPSHRSRRLIPQSCWHNDVTACGFPTSRGYTQQVPAAPVCSYPGRYVKESWETPRCAIKENKPVRRGGQSDPTCPAPYPRLDRRPRRHVRRSRVTRGGRGKFPRAPPSPVGPCVVRPGLYRPHGARFVPVAPLGRGCPQPGHGRRTVPSASSGVRTTTMPLPAPGEFRIPG